MFVVCEGGRYSIYLRVPGGNGVASTDFGSGRFQAEIRKY